MVVLVLLSHSGHIITHRNLLVRQPMTLRIGRLVHLKHNSMHENSLLQQQHVVEWLLMPISGCLCIPATLTELSMGQHLHLAVLEARTEFLILRYLMQTLVA